MKNKKLLTQRILIGVTFIPIIVYLSLVFTNRIWIDEGYTIAMIQHKIKDIWSITANDVHPPLYYWGLRIWCLLFGFSVTSTKIFSIVPLVLMLIVSYSVIKKEFGIKTSIIFSFLFGLCPFMMEYSTQVRMYSWALFLCTVSGLYAYKVIKESNLKNWLIFFITSILSIYTHFYSLITIFMIYLILLIVIIIRKRELLKSFILGSIATIIIFIPWLIELFKQVLRVSKNYWIEPITIKEFLYLPINLLKISGGNNVISKITGLVYVLFILFTLILFIKDKNKDNKSYFAILSLGVFMGVVAISLTISLIIKPILYYRYLLIPFGNLLLFISIIISKNNKNGVIIVFVFLNLIVLIPNYLYHFNFVYDTEYKEMINKIDTVKSTDYIFYSDYNIANIILTNESEKNNILLYENKGTPFDIFAKNIDSFNEVKDFNGDKYYLIYEGDEVSDILKENYDLVDIDSFKIGNRKIIFYKLINK